MQEDALTSFMSYEEYLSFAPQAQSNTKNPHILPRWSHDMVT